MAQFFSNKANLLPLKIIVCLFFLLLGVSALIFYYATPKALRVGYQPDQPIPFDHSKHITQVGLDCRYCHSFVEKSGHATIPSANTCWNCHRQVKRESPKLIPLRRAIDPTFEDYDGKPIEWVRVHKLPDYVYFDHSAHINRGIACQTCHGNINEMKKVYHSESLSMSWCLDCHRSPEKHLRPLEAVFDFDFDAEEFLLSHGERLGVDSVEDLGKKLREMWNVNPKESCTTCHR